MKKFLAVLILVLISSATVSAAPTCVMMKFTNDTRYQNIDSAAVLSDLVLEKLLASGKFNFVETRPLDENLELQLYDEKARDILAAETGAKRGNFNILFENGTFDKNHAQSISTAQVGQIISPSITSQIGEAHNADYLIHGTIIAMGDGNIAESSRQNNIYAYHKEAVMAISADVKIINAKTGEVIWRKNAVGSKKTELVQVGKIIVGTAKLSAEMYNTAMNRCAEKIVADLIADVDANKLFVK